MEATPICQAWLRPDGGKGIRNKVLVLYTVECSKHVAESIAAHFHTIEQGGLTVAGNKAPDRKLNITADMFDADGKLLIQKGKKKFHMVELG